MKKILMGLGAGFGITASLAAIYGIYLFNTVPDPALFDERRVAESTKIYDRTGTVLLYELHGEQKRTILAAETIPERIKQATIALEDKNFYDHAAVDWKSIARAFFANLIHGRIVQGGSTITQQLAKKAFLTDERTVTRKLKELIIAYRLEKKYGKDEILNLYLNQIPYGSNAYGIEAAAQTYFGKSARDLTWGETAIIVSLPNAPSYYSPWGLHVGELMARKNRALERIVEMGNITKEEKVRAEKEKITFMPQTTAIKAPHFTMFVQEYLLNVYGEDFVRNGGLKVTTTLDWPLQQEAEKAVALGAERNEKLYKGKNAALVAEDSTTGHILALVGSRNYFNETIDGNFNVATQGLRQPGSSLKPFTYLTAFIKGFTPDTTLFDLETEFDATGDPDRSYKPHNFDDQFRGATTMREALAQSINVPSVKTLYLSGIDATLKNLHAMGITTLNERNRYGLSLTLGGGEIKLIDLVHAYTVLSQDGVKRRQSFIIKIEDGQRKLLEQYHNEKEQILPPQAIRLINNILSDTDGRAPLFQSSLNLTVFPNHDVALKTGTTNDYRDAWAFGYTPSLVVGVWAGNSDNKPMERQGNSILAAVPIWNSFMKEILKNRPFEPFPQPTPIITDKPVLNNQYLINNEVHTILYYIDKKNPLGPPPSFPERDPQFKNWEQPIIQWLQNNQLVLLENKTPRQNTSGIVIDAHNPQNGSFVTIPFTVNAALTSNEPLTRVELYLNDRLIHQEPLINATQYSYLYTVNEPLNPQNKIILKAINKSQKEQIKEIIVFQ